MLKRIYCIAVISLLCITGSVWAEEGKESVEVTASVKAWVNEWKRVDPAAGRMVSDNVGILLGPAVEVELRNHLVLEGSYVLSARNYDFTDAGVAQTFERADLDLALGKRLGRYAAFFVGYRNAAFKEKETGAKESSYGLTYSLRGTLPLKGESGLFGSVTRLDTRFKAEGVAREEAPGWITEIGGKNVFNEHLSLKVGYKWEVTKGKDSGIKDSFRGTTLELGYAF